MKTSSARAVWEPAAFVVGALMVGMIFSAAAGGGAVPKGVLLLAVVGGLLNALLAVGVVLVFRATRAVTFASGGFAAIGAVLAGLLNAQIDVPWLLALPAGLAAAAALAWVADLLVLRRLSAAPSLVLTIATLAIGQLLDTGAVFRDLGIPRIFLRPKQIPSLDNVTTPFSGLKHHMDPVVLTGDHAAAAVVSLGALVAVAVWLRRSRAGTALRGVADNPGLAEQLGVRVQTVTGLAWIVAALLASLSAMLATADARASVPALLTGASFGLGATIRPLVAAALARFDNPWRAAAAAVALNLLEQCVLWARHDTVWIDGLLVVVVTVGLLTQRRSSSRSAEGVGGGASGADLPPIPAALAPLAEVRRGKRALVTAIALAVLVGPLLMSSSQASVVSLGFLLAIVALSVVVLSGWSGQVSLGQFALAGAGAVMQIWLVGQLGVPWLVALPLSMLAAATAAVVIGLPALRLRGVALAVTTLTTGVAFTTVALNASVMPFATHTTIDRPRLPLVDFEAQRPFAYFCLAFLVLVIVVIRRLRSSPFGAAIFALRDNERAAESLGIDLVRTRLATFAVSGAIAGLAGALIAHHQHTLSLTTFGAEAGLNVLLTAVLGGVASLTGGLLGSAYLTLALVVFPGLVGQVLASSIGVLVLFGISPGGIIELVAKVQRVWLRYLAVRRRLVVDGLLTADELGVGGRRPITPLREVDGQPIAVPAVYRMPSRIGLAGASQREVEA